MPENLFDSVAPSARRIMTLFYVVDSSGSMSGEKIGMVNQAMQDAVVKDLPELDVANDDAEINVAILEFNSGCKWITPETGPVALGDVRWNKVNAGGLTDLGAACLELDKKLSIETFMKSSTGAFAPVFLLMSDGGPTDNWEAGLNQLKTNKWFKNAIKIAIAIGDDADEDVLAAFTGNKESVIRVADTAVLGKLIRKVSYIASKQQSQSKASGTDTTPEKRSAEIVVETMEVMERDDDID